MTQHDDSDGQVPYEALIKHFDRPMQSPDQSFDPDELPDGDVRELYDTVMADYYSHIPAYPAGSSKEKAKFDLIARAQAHVDTLDSEHQSANSNNPEILETAETKQLSAADIKRIVGSYKGARRPTKL